MKNLFILRSELVFPQDLAIDMYRWLRSGPSLVHSWKLIWSKNNIYQARRHIELGYIIFFWLLDLPNGTVHVERENGGPIEHNSPSGYVQNEGQPLFLKKYSIWETIKPIDESNEDLIWSFSYWWQVKGAFLGLQVLPLSNPIFHRNNVWQSLGDIEHPLSIHGSLNLWKGVYSLYILGLKRGNGIIPTIPDPSIFKVPFVSYPSH